MFELLSDAFNAVTTFMNEDVYNFFADMFASLVQVYLLAVIESKLFFIQFSWDIAKNLMTNLGLSSLINSSWSSLDSTLLNYLTFFRIPEAINVLLQASITRFILGLF